MSLPSINTPPHDYVSANQIVSGIYECQLFTYRDNTIALCRETQHLPEVDVCCPADWWEEYHRTSDGTGTRIVDSPILAIIIINSNLVLVMSKGKELQTDIVHVQENKYTVHVHQ